MKFNKVVKENVDNKSGFLVACVCSILLLLTLCYFGVNSKFKGTSAVSTVSCGSKYAVRYIQNFFCCPNASDQIVLKNDKLYCIGNNISVVDAQNEQGWVCQVSVLFDEIDEGACYNQLGDGWELIQIAPPTKPPYTYLCNALPETCATEATPPKEVYSISYKLNGGTTGTYAPKNGFVDEVVNISNPTKKYTVNFDLNDSGATMYEATSKTLNLTFQTWDITNFSSYAQYSVNGTTWFNYGEMSDYDKAHLTATKYKNLAATGETVMFEAIWSGVEISLPTIYSSGGSAKACKWNTKADGSGQSYDSGLSSLWVGTGSIKDSMTLYAVCGNEVCYHTPEGDYLWFPEEELYPGAYDGYVVVPGINSEEECSALNEKPDVDVPDDDEYVCFAFKPAEAYHWATYGEFKNDPNYQYLSGVSFYDCDDKRGVLDIEKFDTYDDYIIVPVGTKVSDLKENISVSYSGNSLEFPDSVKTGVKINVLKSDKTILKEYIVVVLGDANGDGAVNTQDYVLVYNHLSKSSTVNLQNEYLMAADYDSSGTVTTQDYIAIYNYLKR